ncbi:hypothetical protein GCM10022214_02400 [Actinomadura miaoliensis]|uniref:Uncharacterized protein n=2 Tax=Actinomadura miaoliensis TaxID=430685 RepID=A0ABP7UXE6_9ACTN
MSYVNLRGLPGATALEQARTAGRFTHVHDAWWAEACKADGDAAGTRALVEALLPAAPWHTNTSSPASLLPSGPEH